MPPGYGLAAVSLWHKAGLLIHQSLASDSKTVYNTGVRHLRNYLVEMNPHLQYPFTDQDWVLFYTWLTERVSPDSASSYLSHVVYAFETSAGIPRPDWKRFPLLERAKKGARRAAPKNRKRKHPVTYSLACRMVDNVRIRPDTVTELSGMLIFIVILLVGISGWFRLGELIPKSKKTHPEKLIRRGQITIFRTPGMTPYMRIWLFRSKGDTLNEGVPIYIPGNSEVPRHCPLLWMEALLRVTDGPNVTSATPIFVFPNGTLVLKAPFVKWLRRQLRILGLDVSLFAGHSLRIGAAVSAARRGLSDDLIKRLGRWKSDAYLLYVKFTPLSIQKLRTLITQMGTIRD